MLAVVGLLVTAFGCGSSPEPLPNPALERSLKRGQELYDARQFEAATEVLMEALLAAEATDDLFGRAVCYVSLTLCQLRLGNTDSAMRLLGEAERIMPRLDTEQPGIEPAMLHLAFGRYYEAQAELAKAAGNLEQAAEHLRAAQQHYHDAIRS